MIFLIGALFVMAAYTLLKRNEASAKSADIIFYFGVCLIVCGIIGMFIGFYLKHMR